MTMSSLFHAADNDAGHDSPASTTHAAAGDGPVSPGDRLRALYDKLHDVLSCPAESLELAVVTLAAGGDLLLEDVPGVGKTTLAKALARAIGGDMHRIQFTADMLPGDITGMSVFSPKTQAFDFHPGPVFANIVIADEINRANPKTQAALLEAMGERHVSVDGVTYPLPDPFFVIATQNPVEMEGTYPLPEAQLDRFMARTSFGYPTRSREIRMIVETGTAAVAEHRGDPTATLEPVCTTAQMSAIQRAARAVTLGEAVAGYIVDIADATRHDPSIRFGASPRASLQLASLARARALFHGRDYVLPEDVRELAVPALAHRLAVAADAVGSAGDTRTMQQDLVSAVVADVRPPRAT
ncbi:AAA family ATPase [Bifidobacterium choloepi]|uniref:MoxR family ATPase n=1 Tax=Bifidobacterium choloepi TaxID=2614131 RepID=A0A6I5MZK1_9BIFI|nr:MoxR family ATPase [Bifidobacterium choloepi]NEG69255.1 MoxR family ATPase [Bifidobacterium choloepi]